MFTSLLSAAGHTRKRCFSMWYHLFLLGCAASLVGAATTTTSTEGKIWFEGERMPGTNTTIPVSSQGGGGGGGWLGSGYSGQAVGINDKVQGGNVYQGGSSGNKGSGSFGNGQGSGSYGNGMDQGSSTYGNGMNQGSSSYGNGMNQGSSSYGNGMNQGSSSLGTGNNQGSSSFGTGNSQGSTSYGSGTNQGSSSFGTGNNQGSSSFGTGNNQGSTSYGTGTNQGSSSFGTGNNQGSSSFGTGNNQGSTSYGTGTNQGSSSFGTGNNQGSSTGMHGTSEQDSIVFGGNNNNGSSDKTGSGGSPWQFFTKKPPVMNNTYGGGWGGRPHPSSGGGEAAPSGKPWVSTSQLTPAGKMISRGLVSLALDLERAIAEPGNKIFSPVSIASALALVLLGAKGRTKAELGNLFGIAAGADLSYRIDNIHLELGRLFKKLEKRPGAIAGIELAFASGVFVERSHPINGSYIATAKSLYDSEVVPLDFVYQGDRAKDVINKWVSDRTAGRIKDLIPEALSPETRVVIANALYFNGEWEYPFMPNATKMRAFHVSSTEVVDVPMMVNTGEVYYSGDKKRGYRVLGLPYKGRDMYLFLVLPDGDLNAFIRGLTATSLQDIVAQTTIQQIIFTVPRMRLESSMRLKKSLENLGVRSIFDPRTADLSGIAPGVYASEVYHKVQIDVTELGTVAAAATGVTLTRDGSTPIVRVDSPFMFFMYHAPTETVTFWGTVHKPTPNSPHASRRPSSAYRS